MSKHLPDNGNEASRHIENTRPPHRASYAPEDNVTGGFNQRSGLPTGPGTAPAKQDAADPHPSDEEHYDREAHPGGAHPPKGRAAGIELHEHTGSPPPRPKNAENS